MLIWLVYGLWPMPGQPFGWRQGGNTLLLFILLMLLGWKIFGAPIHS